MINDFNITEEFPDLTPFGVDEFDLDDSAVDGMDEYMNIHMVGFVVEGSSLYVAFVIAVQPGSLLDINGTQVTDYREHELAISLSASLQARLDHIRFLVETPRTEFVPGWSLSFAASRPGKRGTWVFTKAQAL